jgi:hypothetical protein
MMALIQHSKIQAVADTPFIKMKSIDPANSLADQLVDSTIAADLRN